MKKTLCIALSLMLLFTAFNCVISVSALENSERIFYIDSQNGNDSNDGLSANRAWKTLSVLSSKTFSSGDKILLNRSSVFDNQCIAFNGSGSADNPIVIGAYGDGDSLPLINAGGREYAVRVRNQNNIIIENLEITNIAESDRFYSGISIVSSGTYNSYGNIIIRNNNIHNITCGKNSYTENGTTIYTEEGAGVFVRGGGWTTDFHDIIIEDNTITDVRGNGIYLSAGYDKKSSRQNTYGKNNIVRNNYLENIGYDGILITNNNGALVEYNVVNRSHNVSKAAEVAIWPFASDNCVFQYNEAYNTQTAYDGQGFDCDYQCDGTVFQYNYGHDNVGGFMLVCTEDRFRPNGGNGVDSYNDNSIIRYNISQNNANRQFQLLGHIKNTKIYNNTIATNWGISAVAVDTYKKNATYTSSEFEGTRPDFPMDTQFVNNLFYDFSSYPTGSYVSKYSFESGTSSNITGNAVNTVWDNNLVFGRSANQAPTKTKLAGDGVTYIISSAENNINSDPMLVDPFSGGIGLDSCDGYKLKEGSPALGAGKIIEDNGGKDFFNNPVPADTAPNIGAYQGEGIKETTAIYYDDTYKTLIDWEGNSKSVTNTNISFVSYVYDGGNRELKITTDKTKLLSSIGSEKGLVFTPKIGNSQISIELISTDIKKSSGLRIYANGDGTACAATLIINNKYNKSVSIPSTGGFIYVNPGDKVYSSDDKGNINLTEQHCKNIYSIKFTFNNSSGKTIYIDDIQLNMKDNLISSDEINIINIPVDTTPGADKSPLVPDKKKEFNIKLDGKTITALSGDSFKLPQNNNSNFICYFDGKNYYDSGDAFEVTEDKNIETIYLNLSMRKGASMRLSENNGIRFYTYFDEDVINSLINNGADVKMGTLIAAYDLLDGEDLTFNIDNSNKVRYVNVPYKAIGKYFIENNEKFIVGSIFNLKIKNFVRNFVGRGYVTVKIGNIEKTVYAKYYNNGISENSRSIAFVADRYKNDTNGTYSSLPQDKKDIVDYYAAFYNMKDDPYGFDKF